MIDNIVKSNKLKFIDSFGSCHFCCHLQNGGRSTQDDVVDLIVRQSVVGPPALPSALAPGRTAAGWLRLVKKGVPDIWEHMPLALWSIEGIGVGPDVDGLLNPPEFIIRLMFYYLCIVPIHYVVTIGHMFRYGRLIESLLCFLLFSPGEDLL